MATYLIIDANVIDEEGHTHFRQQRASIAAAHSGKVLTSTYNCEVIQGDWQPRRVSMLEFPNADHCKRYPASPEQEDLRELRESTTDGVNRVTIEGL